MKRRIIGFIGEAVVLQCRTNDSLSKWRSVRRGDVASRSGVFSGYPRLSLNGSIEGHFDLIIHSAQLEDADTYMCTTRSNTVVQAELTLLGKCFVLICYSMNSISVSK